MAAEGMDFTRVKEIRIKFDGLDAQNLQELSEELETEKKDVARLLTQVRQMQKDLEHKKREAAESSDSDADSEEPEVESKHSKKLKGGKEEAEDKGSRSSQPALYSLQERSKLRVSLERAIDSANGMAKARLLRDLKLVQDVEYEKEGVAVNIDFHLLGDDSLQRVEEWIVFVYKNMGDGMSEEEEEDDIHIRVISELAD